MVSTKTSQQASPSWRWRDKEIKGGRAVVFDMDGVLCNADERQHFITTPNKDWKGFFDACGDDALITETSRLLGLIALDVAVILLTGRPFAVQQTTLDWLERQQLRWDLLIMRDRGDYGASLAFKQQATRKLRALGFDLQLAFEDDSRNQQMFNDEGVPCMYIHSGYYEERDKAERPA